MPIAPVTGVHDSDSLRCDCQCTMVPRKSLRPHRCDSCLSTTKDRIMEICVESSVLMLGNFCRRNRVFFPYFESQFVPNLSYPRLYQQDISAMIHSARCECIFVEEEGKGATVIEGSRDN